MPETQPPLLSFLPASLIWLARRDPGLPRDEVTEAPGAVLSADVSGFSRLTEELVRQGHPVDAISNLLNAFLAELVGIFYEHGGDIVKFAGDGIQALWSAEVLHEPLDELVLRASQCALALLEKVSGWKPEADVAISLHIGIGAGQVELAHLGGRLSRWEFVMAGPAVLEASRAEARAEAGEVQLGPEAWRLLGERGWGQEDAEGEEAGGGLLQEVVEPIEPRPFPHIGTIRPDTLSALRKYLPGSIVGSESTAAEARPGESGERESLPAELRTLSVAFVRIPRRVLTVQGLHELVRKVQDALYRHEGTLNKINVDARGVVLVAAWGLPPFSHSDDAVRAVKSCLEIVELLEPHGGSVGIATGRTFCGTIGGEKRREYTFIGSTVNRAARMMADPEGGLLCDETTFKGAHKRIRFKGKPETRTYKGIGELPVYRPTGVLSALPTSPHGIVARDLETRELSERLQRLVREGVGGTIIIEGGAGVGKTKLAQALVERAQVHGIRVLQTLCDYVNRMSPLQAWRPVLAEILSSELGEDIIEDMEDDSRLGSLLPLLDPVLPGRFPENDTTRGLSPQAREDNTREVYLAVLSRFVEREPRGVIFLFDDAQWFDSSSVRLATAFHRREIRALQVLVLRNHPKAMEPLLGDERLLHLDLRELDSEGTAALLAQYVGAARVPEVLERFFHERTGGNPLFIEELANDLLEKGLIWLEGEPPTGTLGFVASIGDEQEIPTTIDQALQSRIDQLEQPKPNILKTASVIGRVFPFEVISGIYEPPEERALLGPNLEELASGGYTPVYANGPELAYIFKHQLLRDTCYELLPTRTRSALHLRVSRWYEQQHRQDLSPYYPLLAYHCRRGDDPERAVQYLEKAAQEAMRLGAYVEADDFYRQVMELAEDAELRVPALRRADWHAQRGEALCGLGQHEPGREFLVAALTQLGVTFPRRTLASLLRTGVEILLQAKHRLLPSLRLHPKRRQDSQTGVVARAAQRLAQSFYFSNRPLYTLLATLLSLNRSERMEPSSALAVDYANATITTGILGFHGLARLYGRKAVAVAREQGEPWAQAYVEMVCDGLYRLGMGECAAAERSLEHAARSFEKQRDRRRLIEALALLAIAYFHQGHFHDSHETWRRVHRIARERGDRQALVWALTGALENSLRLGREDVAARLLESISHRFAEGDDELSRVERVWTLGSVALAHFRLGHYEQARAVALQGADAIRRLGIPLTIYALEGFSGTLETLLRLREAGFVEPRADQEAALATKRALKGMGLLSIAFPVSRPRVLLGRGFAAWLEGHPRLAARRWSKALKLARKLGLPYEEAMAHLMLGQYRGEERHLALARSQLERLGVAPPKPAEPASSASS